MIESFEHRFQFIFLMVDQGPIHLGQILLVICSGFTGGYQKDQCFQKVQFTVVPELIAFTFAGITDNDIGKYLGHHGIAA